MQCNLLLTVDLILYYLNVLLVQLSWHSSISCGFNLFSLHSRPVRILQHICPLRPVIFGAVLILNVILSSAISNTID